MASVTAENCEKWVPMFFAAANVRTMFKSDLGVYKRLHSLRIALCIEPYRYIETFLSYVLGEHKSHDGCWLVLMTPSSFSVRGFVEIEAVF